MFTKRQIKSLFFFTIIVPDLEDNLKKFIRFFFFFLAKYHSSRTAKLL